VNALQVKVQYRTDYQKAPEELEPHLLQREYSTVRDAEYRVRVMETSNLIFIFSKFNFLVYLRELR